MVYGLAAGIALLGLGILLLLVARLGKKTEVGQTSPHESKWDGGAVILIGPIPIVIGKNVRVAKELLLLALAVFVVMILLYVFARRSRWKGSRSSSLGFFLYWLGLS